MVASFQSQPITGCDHILEVQSNDPEFIFGGQGPGEGTFLSPRAVVIDSEGCLYIADTGNRQVLDKLIAKSVFYIIKYIILSTTVTKY